MGEEQAWKLGTWLVNRMCKTLLMAPRTDCTAEAEGKTTDARGRYPRNQSDYGFRAFSLVILLLQL